MVEFANSYGEHSASFAWYKTYGDVYRFKGFLGVSYMTEFSRSYGADVDWMQRDMLHIVDPKAIATVLSQGPLFEKDFADKPRIAAMFGQGLHSSIGWQNSFSLFPDDNLHIEPYR